MPSSPLSVSNRQGKWNGENLLHALGMIALLAVPIGVPSLCQSPPLTAQEIIHRSAEATRGDWEKAPNFDFCELDRNDHETRAYQVLMIGGAPFDRLVRVNGQEVSLEVQEKEEKKLEERQRSTPEEQAREKAQFERERRRDRLLLEEFTSAMEYRLLGTEMIYGHDAYVIDATPRPGYVPKNHETAVLTAMRGKLWVDQASFRWVKVQAEVTRPVTIEGFLARVEPGTRFELEEKPAVDTGIWLASHFAMRTRAKIFLIFPKNSNEDETYFHYKPNGSLSLELCLQPE